MDRRVARTTKVLLEALKSLMKDRSWDQINVQQICDHADVARSTFYAHFDNKQKLLDYGFSSLESELSGETPGRGLGVNGAFSYLPLLLEHIAAHRDLFRTNANPDIGSDTSYVIFSRFKVLVDALAADEVRRSGFAEQISADQIAFINGGVFALLERWNRRGCKQPAEDLLNHLDGLIATTLGDRFRSCPE